MKQVIVTYAPSNRHAIVNVETDDEWIACREAARYVFETHGYPATSTRFTSEWRTANATVKPS